MATHSSILAWRFPWIEGPSGLVYRVMKSRLPRTWGCAQPFTLDTSPHHDARPSLGTPLITTPLPPGHAPPWPRPRPPCPSFPLWVPYSIPGVLVRTMAVGRFGLSSSADEQGLGLAFGLPVLLQDLTSEAVCISGASALKWPCDKARRPPLFHFVSTNRSRQCSLGNPVRVRLPQVPCPQTLSLLAPQPSLSSEGFSFSTPIRV